MNIGSVEGEGDQSMKHHSDIANFLLKKTAKSSKRGDEGQRGRCGGEEEGEEGLE